MQTELGPAAADYYIQQCIHKVQTGAAEGLSTLESLEVDERIYLRMKLGEVEIPSPGEDVPVEYHHLSPKVQTLISFLREEISPDFSGIVFVRTRVEVAVLSHILAIHTSSLEISTFIGASNFSGRKAAISELADVKNQKTTLADLRQGRKNLIVTTNALEEGIDVSRCRLIVCFDRPNNLKSFIQRRGRARKSDSKYVITFQDGLTSEITTTWPVLEAQMTGLYSDHMRQIRDIQNEENLSEETTHRQKHLTVSSTGYVYHLSGPCRSSLITRRAKLTFDDAVQHLSHFCATLPAAPYADRAPIFFFEDHSTDMVMSSISAHVLLPNSVDASVREARGTFRWRTEKMAKKDAAFEAYRALYVAGLVDHHLLPLGHVDDAIGQAYSAVEKRPNLVEVDVQINPWTFIAQKWQSTRRIQASLIKVIESGVVYAEMMLLLPIERPIADNFHLYWNDNRRFKAIVEQSGKYFDLSVIAPAAQSTALLMQSVFPGRLDIRNDFTALFVPCDTADLEAWLQVSSGGVQVEDIDGWNVSDQMGLIRDLSQSRAPYILRSISYGSLGDNLSHSPSDIDGDAVQGVTSLNILAQNGRNVSQYGLTREPYSGHGQKLIGVSPKQVEVEKLQRQDVINKGDADLDLEVDLRGTALLEVIELPKKVNFLHCSSEQDAKVARGSRPRTLFARRCEMDRLPFRYSQFAMFIPSILHRIEIALVVDRLCEGILSSLAIKDRNLVATAISAPSANQGTDYQRLEFFGDSILKYTTSLTLMAEYLNWHEGILSHQKDHIVSNSSLASAARELGLDQYIVTKAFTGRRWRPMYNSVLLESQPVQKREMSSKTLADVVEALIGAAYLDGGLPKALACLSIFLPGIQWLAQSDAHRILYTVYNHQIPSIAHLAQVEQLTSYQFNNKTLLREALTHASHHGGSNSSSSYQRLEFLGDAVLDKIVSRTAFSQDPPIPTHKLHLIRTALVNGNYLGFLCLNHSMPQTRTDPVIDDRGNVCTVEVVRQFYLWQAMRHASPTITFAQQQFRFPLPKPARFHNRVPHPWEPLPLERSGSSRTSETHVGYSGVVDRGHIH